MASPTGNPNTPVPFDVNKLFKPALSPTSSSPFGPPPASAPSPTLAQYSSPPPPYSAPPHATFSYPSPTPPFHHQTPFLHYPPPPISYPTPPPNPNPNPGARLMALLGSAPPLESAVSMPPPSPSEPPILHAIPSAPPAITAVAQPPPRNPSTSSKMPRGRYLGGGDRVVHDVDSRLPGETVPPQLEVAPITKYTSDPGLVLGRQIAVNRTYICYGLKLGAIRVLNINTALRSLLRGHTQRVTDMAFFAEDAHFLASASIDGRVFVWKIDEGPDDEDKPQITGRIITAIQMVGDRDLYHPRICWHSHKQEILIVGIGNRAIKIDIMKVGRGKEFSAEDPLRCTIEELIDGVQLIGKHDGEVTDLSISQWMMTRIVSASKDGTVKIWDDRRMMPLVTLRPHDGQPVNSVAFLTAPNRPDHIVLVTGGLLNRELKMWASAGTEGWLSSSDSESWQCIQTLELRSSSEPRVDEAFFNQVVVLPHSSLILLANAKKNAIYALHIEFGPCPTATHMDFIADFTVAMPILSLTGTRDFFSDGEQLVQVYCVQTQAIQQYALDVTQCLPPPIDNMGPGRDSSLPHVSETSISANPFPVSNLEDPAAAIYPVASDASDISNITSSSVEFKPSAPPLPSAEAATAMSMHSASEHDVVHSTHLVERTTKVSGATLSDVSSVDDNLGKVDPKSGPSDITMLPNSLLMNKLGSDSTHLVTPSEILSGAPSSTENTLRTKELKVEAVKNHDVIVSKHVESVQLAMKVTGESGASQHGEFDTVKEGRDALLEINNKSFTAESSEANIGMDKECSVLRNEIDSVQDAQSLQVDDVAVIEALERPSITGEVIQESVKDLPEKVHESSLDTASQSLSAAKGKKLKGKQPQTSIRSPPLSSPFNSTDSSDELTNCSIAPSIDAIFSQLRAMQDTLNQLMIMQKEIQKQMSTMVSVPVNKEGKRIEAALGRSIEKAIKAGTDALWARFQEENAKHEKVERDRVQQMTNLITSSMNKEIPAMFERALKKEISALGPPLARTITPIIEKTISSSIAESFQRGVSEKAVNQLEKSVNSKLEATVARQIQAQFQTSGKQALQDALRLTLESSVIPAFERSCKAMFEQVDTAFQKGMAEHTTATQQQFESMHTPLALTLRDAINSASSITQNLTTELADDHRKFLALVTAGNANSLSPTALQPSNGPSGGVPEMNVQPPEPPLDPTKDLTRLLAERKYEEAFMSALQRSDVSIVSWLCSQVDMRAICSMIPPLSQGVLLSLLQQLAYDIGNDTSQKLGWITEVAAAIIPTDPLITIYVRPIFEQVYNALARQRSLPTTTSADAGSIRLIMHIINSVLMGCK